MTLLQKIPKADQPRSKLKRFGSQYLTESELLALLIGTGDPSRKRDVLELSREILANFGSIHNIDKLPLSKLSSIAGLGEAKASRIKAACEFGRRLMTKNSDSKAVFSSAKQIYEAYAPRLISRSKEVFIAVMLNAKLQWVSDIKIAEGSMYECVIKPSDVFASILPEYKGGVIFLHNHPSGDPEPSKEDDELTKRLVISGTFLGVRILDHVIIGSNGYYSFSDAGKLDISKTKKGISSAQLAVIKNKDWELASETEVDPDICCIHDFTNWNDFDPEMF